jgi:D-alanyl-D-alanine carboxypeptidase-like protein
MAPKRKAKSRSKAKKGAGKPGAKKKKQISKKRSARKKKAAVVEEEAAQQEEVERALAAAAAVATVEADAAGLADKIPIPPANTFNVGLHSASEATMLSLLGVPGNKTRNCSSPTGQFARRVKFNVNVGPFRVSGLDFAVASLKEVFDEARTTMPEVVAAVKTEGMLCVRHKRNNPDSFSNHSWGAAIDLFFGSDVVPQGERKTHRGVLKLMPIFNRHGWYWGAGFSRGSVDSMHFELAEETIRASESRPA